MNGSGVVQVEDSLPSLCHEYPLCELDEELPGDDMLLVGVRVCGCAREVVMMLSVSFLPPFLPSLPSFVVVAVPKVSMDWLVSFVCPPTYDLQFHTAFMRLSHDVGRCSGDARAKGISLPVSRYALEPRRSRRPGKSLLAV